MRCGKCGKDNREGRRFCAECGFALNTNCTRCGAANKPGEKFCGECGAALAGGSGTTPFPGAAPVIAAAVSMVRYHQKNRAGATRESWFWLMRRARQAVALALVGWYLMLPTPYGTTDLDQPPNLPIPRWKTFQTFDTADDCEQIFSQQQQKYTPKLHSPDPVVRKLARLWAEAQCVSTDDPRLKEK